jgi:hypothetical protein
MKKDLADFKRNGKANLIKCMDAMSRVDEGQNMYENELFIKECKKAINYLAKKQLTLVLKAVRTNKNGTYSPYYFAQLVQKVVRLKMNKDMTYIQALKDIIESK